MDYFENYMKYFSSTPKEFYDELNQETINLLWDDTNRLYTIKEQVAYPFKNEWVEYEAWLSSVSDNNINTNKSVNDFISVLFKDNNHPFNHRGQYYKITLDGEHEETYICYDKMNVLSQTSDFKVVRCNQTLRWVDKTNGDIIEMPCYIGYDLSSTNNQYAKDGAIPNARLVIYVQANEQTMNIEINQRFMFMHKQCYKVEQVEDYETDQFCDNPTMVKLYIAYSPLLAVDNAELNLCDYYSYKYNIQINQKTPLYLKVGDVVKLDSTVYLNNEIKQGLKTIWTVDDKTIGSIDLDGNLTILSDKKDTLTVSAYIDTNDDVKDDIIVYIVKSEEKPTDRYIYVSPKSKVRLLIEEEQPYEVGVYEENTKVDIAKVVCTPNWVGNEYTLTFKDNKYIVTNNSSSDKPLILTFTYEDLTPVKVELELGGWL